MTGSSDAVVSGRHRSRRRNRRNRRHRVAILVQVVLATTALVLCGVAVRAATPGEVACPDGVRTLDVAAAPEIAESLARIDPTTDGWCLQLRVTAREPGEVVALLGSANSAAQRPDVWVPDSTLWVQRAQATGVRLPEHNPALAVSPVVLAVPVSVARRAGWPGQALPRSQKATSCQSDWHKATFCEGWAQLVAPGNGVPPANGRARQAGVTIGLPDPGRSASGVSGLLGVEAAAAKRGDARAALTGVLRSVRPGLGTPAEQLKRLGPSGAGQITAVLVSEQAVWAHTRTHGSARVVVAYPPAGTPALDYPYVVLDQNQSVAAERLLAALLGAESQARLGAEGFRTADGRPGAALQSEFGVDPAAPTPAADWRPDAVANVVRTFETVRLGSRMLAVVDVSGSMGYRVAGAGSATRLDLTKQAAARGLRLFPHDSAIGFWVFSTYLTSRTDYREVVPLGPLSDDARAALAGALGTVRHRVGGGTALYDTTLAAVRAVRRGWDPSKVNTVVLLTDGQNEDPNGISRSALLAQLKREADPKRPVPVITIAYGPDSDRQTLSAIARATGGAAYVAADPRRVTQVFLDAIGQRACRPTC